MTKNEELLVETCKMLLKEIADIGYATGYDYGVYINRYGDFKFDNPIEGVEFARKVLKQFGEIYKDSPEVAQDVYERLFNNGNK
jgi:hypothetical protein